MRAAALQKSQAAAAQQKPQTTALHKSRPASQQKAPAAAAQLKVPAAAAQQKAAAAAQQKAAAAAAQQKAAAAAAQQKAAAAAVQQKAQAAAAAAAATARSAALKGIPPKVTGALMLEVNQAGHTRRLGYDDTKQSIIEAVHQVFPGGHVQVQSQGSTAKGTALPSSDWDFFLRLDNTIDTVTQPQRKQCADLIHQNLAGRGLRYRMQLKSNCIRFYEGSNSNGQALPGVDVMTQRFKADQRLEPNNKALASSHVRQQVVKRIKLMPESYTNLKGPKSSRLEEFSRLVEAELGLGRSPLQSKAGFALLLGTCLRKISGELGTTAKQEEWLVEAGLRDVNCQWKDAARDYLRGLQT